MLQVFLGILNATLTLALAGIVIRYGRRLMNFATYNKTVNEETNRIAGVFAVLLAKAQTPAGLTPEEQAEAQGTIDHMKSIGATEAAAPAADAPVVIPTAPATPLADALGAATVANSPIGTPATTPESLPVSDSSASASGSGTANDPSSNK